MEVAGVRPGSTESQLPRLANDAVRMAEGAKEGPGAMSAKRASEEDPESIFPLTEISLNCSKRWKTYLGKRSLTLMKTEANHERSAWKSPRRARRTQIAPKDHPLDSSYSIQNSTLRTNPQTLASFLVM